VVVCGVVLVVWLCVLPVSLRLVFTTSLRDIAWVNPESDMCVYVCKVVALKVPCAPK